MYPTNCALETHKNASKEDKVIFIPNYTRIRSITSEMKFD